MAAPFAQYDPLSVIITFGPVLFVGLAEGTFVEAQRDEDAFTKKVGATGDTVRVKNRNKGGSVKVTLLQTSPTNQLLSLFHKAGEVVPLFPFLLPANLAALGSVTSDVQPIQIQDVLGQTKCHAVNAWIKKVSNVPYAKDLSAREWTFDCESLDIDIGSAP